MKLRFLINIRLTCWIIIWASEICKGIGSDKADDAGLLCNVSSIPSGIKNYRYCGMESVSGLVCAGIFVLNDLFMKFYHWKYPKRCLGYSEYGAEGMPNLHSASENVEITQKSIRQNIMNICWSVLSVIRSCGLPMCGICSDFAADARDQGGEPGDEP